MQWEVIIPPELQPLCRALAELRLSNRQILRTASRLTEPPESLSLPAPGRTKAANELINKGVGFDGDMAARVLRLGEGQHDPGATWAALTPAERKRAKRGWDWVCDAGLDVAPQGRSTKVDSALILYCMRVLAEAEGCGNSRFRFSRPTDGGAPSGPMWRALMAALPLAESYLASVEGLPGSPRQIDLNAETVADVATTARSKSFAKLSEQLKLGQGSNDVANQPGTFRYALSIARRPRRRTRRQALP
jgi:hypothetical protein